MSLPLYTITKLLPLVLLSSCFSVIIVYSFRYIVSQPLYQNITELTHIVVAPLIGTIILIILFYLFAKHLKSGLPHVVLEFHLGFGHLPILNLIFQYLTASIALIMGFAVGTIGPAVHIGAGSANLMGQFFRVQPHTLRVLTACGCAVAITVMLDTPLMGILFTYETIIRQFRWRTLILVSAAALISQWFAHLLGISSFTITVIPHSLSILLLLKMILFGCLCGFISSLYLNSIDLLTRKVRFNYWIKLLLTGLLTSLFAYLSPETLGLGYELLPQLLYTNHAIPLLTVWLVIFFTSSAVALALGVPGGVLGPCLILGALSGAIFSQLFQLPEQQLFIIAGMGALLGSVLHVPLAGILFALEKTNEISLLLPSLLASYSAFYIHRRFSKQNNLIELLLVRQNIILRNSPSLKRKRLTSPL